MIILLWMNLSAKDTPIDNSLLRYGADIWTAPNWAGWGIAETVTATKELDDTRISHKSRVGEIDLSEATALCQVNFDSLLYKIPKRNPTTQH